MSKLLFHWITINDTKALGWTPLDEGSARRWDLYLTTHKSHKRKTSMRWRDSSPQTQQTKGRRSTLYTARPLGSAKFATSNSTINNSMDSSPASEANGRPASQGIRHILCNTTVLCDFSTRCHQSLSWTKHTQLTTVNTASLIHVSVTACYLQL